MELPKHATPPIRKEELIWQNDLINKGNPKCKKSKISVAGPGYERPRVNGVGPEFAKSNRNGTKSRHTKDLISRAESTIVTSSREGEDSGFDFENTDVGKPKRAGDLKGDTGPKCKKSRADKAEPKCVRDLNSNSNPGTAMSQTKSEESAQANPKEGTEEPSCARLREEVKRPGWPKSKINISSSSLVPPNTGRRNPKRPKPRANTTELECTGSRTSNALPRRKAPRTGGEKPICTRSKTGKLKPGRLELKEKKDGSAHAQLCKERANPSCKKSMINGAESNLAKPWSDSNKAMWAKSNAGSKRLGRVAPKTNRKEPDFV